MIFDGIKINLNHKFGIFVTMNPMYKGRNILPDNIKCILRPIAMNIPDYSFINEIILISEGKIIIKDLLRGKYLAKK